VNRADSARITDLKAAAESPLLRGIIAALRGAAMPIYEYRCTSCGFQKEYLQKISDPVMSVCPECRKSTFSKMVTAAGFQLKGSGWYATDFRNSGAKPPAKAAAESTSKGAAPEGKDSSTGKSDKKDASPKSGGNTESKSEAAA
jgi:putative FmdB family regulatory protein